MGVLQQAEFQKLKEILYEKAGVNLQESRLPSIRTHLEPRLASLKIESFAAYLRFAQAPGQSAEIDRIVDLLTIHETYFFRENDHFDILKNEIVKPWKRTRQLRIWSAACSSGEEAYSAAMVLAAEVGMSGWQIVGTDISKEVIRKAQLGQYPLRRLQNFPSGYLKRFCLKGSGRQERTFLVQKELQKKVEFKVENLMESLDSLGRFDGIFLRNVLIYFTRQEQLNIVERVTKRLLGGGILFLGSADSLRNYKGRLKQIGRCAFQKY